VVAAARAHRDAGLEAEGLRGLLAQRADDAERPRDRRQGARPVARRVDRAKHGVAVTAGADIEVRGARCGVGPGGGLAGHAGPADGESLTAQRIADRAPERVDPPAGVLLARTVIAFDELVWRATHGEDTAGRRVAQYDFGRLRAAVHAEKDTSHFSCRRG